jgi:hypothetical protein
VVGVASGIVQGLPSRAHCRQRRHSLHARNTRKMGVAIARCPACPTLWAWSRRQGFQTRSRSSEYDVGLGKSLLTEIDKGLRTSRAGIVLVTPAMLKTLEAATGIASKELAALLATDRVIPVAHGTDFDALRDVSPLLGARSGLTTGAALSLDEAAKKIAAATAAQDAD